MIRPTPQDTSALAEYIRLLVELHELTVDGRDESEKADELRDRMDGPWRSLDASQLALVDGLSADLYTLGVEREAPQEFTSEATAFEKYSRAIDESRWDRVLETIRQNEQQLLPRLVAYLRGVAWARLREPDVAILFLNEAARLGPLNPEEEVWLLSCMTEAGRSVESMPRVREILRSATDPLLLLQASLVYFDAAIRETGDTVVPQLRECIQVAERALDLAARSPSSDSLDSMRCSVLLHLAITYDQFGEREAATEACRRALELDPERQSALTMLGYLTFDRYSDSQRASFRHQFHRELAVHPEHDVGLALAELN